MAWETEHHAPSIMSDRLERDLNEERTYGIGDFDEATASRIREGGHNDIIDAGLQALAANVLSKLGKWANLSSTTAQEIGDARDDISTAEGERGTTKAKDLADKADKVNGLISLVPGAKAATEWVSKAIGAAHAAADIAEGEQEFVTQQALDILKEEKKKKEEIKQPVCSVHDQLNAANCTK